MPRLRRKGLRERGLNNARRETLLFGYVMTAHGEEGFESEEQERVMWERYRDELLAECNQPGRRPHAYFKYEVGIDLSGRRWYDELAALLDHDLIGAEEAARLDENDLMLSGKAADRFCSSYDDEGYVRQLGLNSCTAECQAKEFEVVARWHEWRGRKELAERYRTRAGLVRSCVKAA